MARETRSKSKPIEKKIDVVQKPIQKPQSKKPELKQKQENLKQQNVQAQSKGQGIQKGIKRTKTMIQTQKEGQQFLQRVQEKNKIEKQKMEQKKLNSEKKSSKSDKLNKKQNQEQIDSSKKVTDIQKTDAESEKSIDTISSVQPESIQTKDKKTEETKDIPQQMQEEQQETVQGIIPRTNSRIGLKGGPTAGLIDIVFCCDTTGSMGSYLNQTKQAVTTIINKIEEQCKGEDINVKFGFVAYRDHPPQDTTYVTLKKDLCQKEEILKFINTLNASGGGDGPEAVMPGLMEAAKNISYRSTTQLPTLRYIFHICDAPPHGELYGGFSSLWKDGDPSGITIKQVSHVININEIHYRLIKCTNYGLDKMSQIFQEKFTNYEETTLSNAKELDIRITDMIIRELCADMDYNLDV